MTIGVKRETSIEQTAGPGTYNHERADSIVKRGIRAADFQKSPERP